MIIIYLINTTLYAYNKLKLNNTHDLFLMRIGFCTVRKDVLYFTGQKIKVIFIGYYTGKNEVFFLPFDEP